MPARQVLLITVIGDDAYLDLHTADPDLGRPIYPPLGSIRVPALDLTETLAVQIENDQALAV